jgi:tRNA pseudouridine55 synthase
VNGLLVIDKPGGMTSHDVVGRLRRITGERSVGHLGTLDPMATGVLPLLLGKFTLGQVRAAASRFHGEMEQTPPSFSAKKIAGKPAYKLAREGRPVELKAAKVHIASFEITGLEGAEASFTMSISAGGYVRSVAHELGQGLGCGAHLSRLRRTQAGVFTIDEAHTLEELESLTGDVEALEAKCVHPRSLLPEMPAVTGDAMALGRLRNGAQANLPEFSRAPLVKVFAGQRELVGIAKRVAGTLFQPVVVMG